MAYDLLREQQGIKSGNKQYLKVLELVGHNNETIVNEILRLFLRTGMAMTFEAVEARVWSRQQPPPVTQVHVEEVDLAVYDRLLDFKEMLV